MQELQGKVIANGADLTGYSLRLTYTLSDPNDPKQTGSANVPSTDANLPIQNGDQQSLVQRSYSIATNGTFVVKLPENNDPVFTAEVLSPAGEVLYQHQLNSRAMPKPWEIPINATPRIVLRKPGVVAPNRLKKLSGRVIDRNGSQTVGNLQVILTGQSSDGTTERVLLSARTDREGYFSGAMPVGKFIRAFAIVGIGSPSERIEVGLVDGDWPNPVTLLVDGQVVSPSSKDGCTCETTETALRVPDQDDLVISPASFSNDAGTGGCVSFTVPNRVVEEFSFYYLVRNTVPKLRIRLQQQPLEALRLSLDTDQEVDWDKWHDPRRRTEAAQIAVGHLLHFKQVWRADGYSLGDLLYSLPLAPCEKKQIAIVDWTRRGAGTRDDSATISEQLTASLSRDRDIREVIALTLREMIRGESGAITAGLAAAGGYASGGGVVGVAGGVGGAYSTANQEGARQLAGDTEQRVRDTTLQAASAVRSARSTVVQQVSEGERSEVQTSVVHNHNHCHALTIQYFEVLRHFQVTQELVDVRECLFVPLPIRAFDPADLARIQRWRTVLQSVLRRSELKSAFDVVERRLQGIRATSNRIADEAILEISGEIEISFDLPEPFHFFDEDLAVAAPGGNTSAFNVRAWAPYSPFLNGDPRMWFDSYLAWREKDELRDSWQTRIAPHIIQQFVDGLEFEVEDASGRSFQSLGLDATLVTPRYAPGVPLRISVRPGATSPAGLTRAAIRRIRIRPGLRLGALPSPLRAVVRRVHLIYHTARADFPFIANARPDDDLPAFGSPEVEIGVILSANRLQPEEIKNAATEEEALIDQLLAELNGNLEHYHRAMWSALDTDRRFMMLDEINTTPYTNNLSVAQVTENRLLAIVGNSLVLPVAPGFQLDVNIERNGQPVSLLDHYTPERAAPAMRISVPTQGVFAEAVMGSCNSCEVKDDSRFWRPEESPCAGGEPPQIAPVSTESRRGAEPDLRSAGVPASIINMQAPPSLPDPTGLTSALQVLATANMFRDMAGLEGTQRNAASALQQSLGAAQALAGRASQQYLAHEQMRFAAENERMRAEQLPSTLRHIADAQQAGRLTPDQARELTAMAIRNSSGGYGQPTNSDIAALERAVATGNVPQESGREALVDMHRTRAGVGPAPRSGVVSNDTVDHAVRTGVDDGREVEVVGTEGSRVRVGATQPSEKTRGSSGPATDTDVPPEVDGRPVVDITGRYEEIGSGRLTVQLNAAGRHVEGRWQRRILRPGAPPDANPELHNLEQGTLRGDLPDNVETGAEIPHQRDITDIYSESADPSSTVVSGRLTIRVSGGALRIEMRDAWGTHVLHRVSAEPFLSRPAIDATSIGTEPAQSSDQIRARDLIRADQTAPLDQQDRDMLERRAHVIQNAVREYLQASTDSDRSNQASIVNQDVTATIDAFALEQRPLVLVQLQQRLMVLTATRGSQSRPVWHWLQIIASLHTSEMREARERFHIVGSMTGGLDAPTHTYRWRYTLLQQGVGIVGGAVGELVIEAVTDGWQRSYFMVAGRVGAGVGRGETPVATGSGDLTTPFPWTADDFNGVVMLAGIDAGAAFGAGASVGLSSMIIFRGSGNFPELVGDAGGVDAIYGVSAGVELSATVGYVYASRTNAEAALRRMNQGVGATGASGYSLTRSVSHFDNNVNTLNDAGRRAVRHFLAQHLAAVRDSASQITVNGYTDTLGNDRDNQTLSQLRADNVVNFMHAVLPTGILARTRAIGRGETPARNAGLPDGTGHDDPRASEWRKVEIELNGHVVWRLFGR